MADMTCTHQAPSKTPAALFRDPVRRLGEAIAEFFAPDVPRAADEGRSLHVELQPEPGRELRIEFDDDALTVRGAVLTIRGSRLQPGQERQKYYY